MRGSLRIARPNGVPCFCGRRAFVVRGRRALSQASRSESACGPSNTDARYPHVSDVNVPLPLPRFPSARGIAAVAPLRAERSQVIARAPSSCLSPSSPGHFSWLLLFGPAKRSDPDAGRRSEARRRRAPWRKGLQQRDVIQVPAGQRKPAAGEHPRGRRPSKRVLRALAGKRKPPQASIEGAPRQCRTTSNGVRLPTTPLPLSTAERTRRERATCRRPRWLAPGCVLPATGRRRSHGPRSRASALRDPARAIPRADAR